MENYDVIIVGGGAAGLMTAQKLAQIGLRIAVIEKNRALASGPSTRNEGWLHRGTYHACSIANRAAAYQVARRCIYGHKQLKAYAPEAIEDRGKRPVVLLRDGERIDEIKDRWDDAGVAYRQISHKKASRLMPDADMGRAAGIFLAKDVSINTRLLYRKLVGTIRAHGGELLVAHDIIRAEGTTLELVDSEAVMKRVSATRIIYATGAGTRSLYKKLHGVDIPMRYWKSHLIVTRRLAPMGVFYLDTNEAAMMHHGDISVIGFNEDAVLCEKPSYDVIPDRAENLREGIRRIFPSWNDASAMDIACVKVDLVEQKEAKRSLNVAIQEPVPGHIVALPGKLTETPYLTDVLVGMIHNTLEDVLISERPCDRYAPAI